MGKKENAVIAGLTVAGLLLGGTQAKANIFKIDAAGIKSSVAHDHDEGKCGDDEKGKKKKKKSDGSCGEGSCG